MPGAPSALQASLLNPRTSLIVVQVPILATRHPLHELPSGASCRGVLRCSGLFMTALAKHYSELHIARGMLCCPYHATVPTVTHLASTVFCGCMYFFISTVCLIHVHHDQVCTCSWRSRLPTDGDHATQASAQPTQQAANSLHMR